MAIVETSWAKFLALDSDLPPDVFFRVKNSDEEEKDTNKLIPAHKHSLAGVSPVFRSLLYGPWKDAGEVIEVKETTFEAFDTMIKYIYKPPSSVYGCWFFSSGNPYGYEDPEDRERELKKIRIECPQKFFDLLKLADMYQILSLTKELTSNAFYNLDITDDNVIFTAKVARDYRTIFEDVSIRLLAKCLKFLLAKTSRTADIWIRFWALVNRNEDPEEQLQKFLAFQAKLEYTPFASFNIATAKAGGLYWHGDEDCLYLACSGAHVSSQVELVDGKLSIVVKADSRDISEVEIQNRALARIKQPLRQVPTEFKVQIEHTPRRATGKGRKMEHDSDWTCTCTCNSYKSVCKHVGACLIVHFH